MSNINADEPAGTDHEVAPSGGAAHHHHLDLWAELTVREADLVNAVADGQEHQPAQRHLVDYLHGDVLTHLQTEERVLYNAARGAGAGPLVDTLELDHQSILTLVENIDQAKTGLDAALSARALMVLFALRMEKEESVLIPALTEAGVDVSILLQGRPEVLGTQN